VRLVQLPVAVTTGSGRAATGLAAEDFRVFEDTIPQEIKYFSTRDEGPISVAFLLDLSGSMRALDKLERAKGAIRTIAGALRPEDRMGLIGFADEQVTWITEFTPDRDEFLARLAVQRGFGRTALYDAMAAAPGLVAGESTGRSAVVLVTDGIDNASRMGLFQAMRLARSVEVPIYAVGFSNIPRAMAEAQSSGTMLRVLELMAEETGGILFTVQSEQELVRAARRIEGELRTSYVIGYFSTQTNWDGRFRRVRVETSRGNLPVRTRRGYYARP
jgi:Ca-activated chloride channel family protein